MCGARRLLLIETCSLAYTGRRVLEGKQKSRSPEEPRRLIPLGRSFSPLTANTPGRTYDSASVAPTAVATIIDPVDGGRRKSSSSYMFCCEALLSAICTDLLAFCEGVNVFGGSCKASKKKGRTPIRIPGP